MKSFTGKRATSRPTGGRIGLRRAVLVATIGLAVVVNSTASRAGDDDDDALLDTKIVRGVLKAFGLRRDDDQNIDYRERSPLVLPTGKSLPPPENANAVAKTPDWPDDPDVKEKRRRRLAEKNRKAYVEGVDDRPMLPSDYSAKGPVPTPRSGLPWPLGGDTGSGKSAEASAQPSSPKELGTKGIFSSIFAPKEEYTTFSGEPARESLTDPPAGYRTPSPNQPYGVGKEKWKPPTAVDRQEPAR
jgi:hypothetical protein